MTLTISNDREGFERLRERVRGMRERTQDLTTAWQAVLDHFADRNFRQFTSRGGEYGTPWPVLAPTTLAEKRRNNWPRDPLVRHGDLVHSITLRPLAIERVRPDSLVAGTDDPKAAYHQYGTRRMPARPLFDPAEFARSRVVAYAVANWIIDGERSTRPRTLRG